MTRTVEQIRIGIRKRCPGHDKPCTATLEPKQDRCPVCSKARTLELDRQAAKARRAAIREEQNKKQTFTDEQVTLFIVEDLKKGHSGWEICDRYGIPREKLIRLNCAHHQRRAVAS